MNLYDRRLSYKLCRRLCVRCELAITYVTSDTFFLRPRDRWRSIVMSVCLYVCPSVCLCLYVREHISGTSTPDLYLMFVHVAYIWQWLDRFSSGRVTKSKGGPGIFLGGGSSPLTMHYSGMDFATMDRFRLNLLIYRNVGQNAISYH